MDFASYLFTPSASTKNKSFTIKKQNLIQLNNIQFLFINLKLHLFIPCTLNSTMFHLNFNKSEKNEIKPIKIVYSKRESRNKNVK